MYVILNFSIYKFFYLTLQYRQACYFTQLSLLFSMLKENIYPSKQGEFYRLNLNNNEGPYLAKDISNNNKQSISLLSGKVSLQQFNHCTSALTQLYSKTRQINSQYPSQADNIVAVTKHFDTELTIIQKDSQKLKKEEAILKKQMQVLFQNQKNEQKTLYAQCMPLLKSLFKNVQQFRTAQNNQFHLMQRNINSMNQTKQAILKGLIKCQQSIMNLQRFIGHGTHDNQHNSTTYQEEDKQLSESKDTEDRQYRQKSIFD